MISPHQHGFMAGRSTTSNLVEKTQFISEVLDRGNQVDVIYTDFSKAFDRLDHHMLLNKFDLFGFALPLIELFASYFSNRYQYVEYRGYKSAKFSQTSGVPQGSILGPLFFVVFINGLTEYFDIHFLLYADDLKIFIEINSISDSDKLQNNLNRLNDWCNANKLPLNTNKCYVMSYSRRKTIELFNYKLESTVLNRVTQFKDLGVTFEPNLSFEAHIQRTTDSALRSLGFILRNSRDFSYIKTFNILYAAFVRCKLEYASIVWSPIYDTYINQLERVQRRYLKSLHFFTYGNYPPRGTPQNALLSTFNLSSLCRRRTMNSLIFLYKLINNSSTLESTASKITYRVPNTNLRANSILLLPTARTNLLIASPLYQMLQNYHMYEDRLDIFHTSITSIKRLVI